MPRPLRVHPSELNKSFKPNEGLPGGRAVKTLHFRCQGPRFDPWSESEDPTNHLAKKQKMTERNDNGGRIP